MLLPTPLRKTLAFLGAAALLILLLGAWAIVSNGLASRKAERFCSSISIGEPVTNLVARAKSDSGIIVVNDSPSEVVFIFHGFVFANATCHAKIQGGVVISKVHYPARD